jgi:hypothetical protein
MRDEMVEIYIELSTSTLAVHLIISDECGYSLSIRVQMLKKIALQSGNGPGGIRYMASQRS